MQASRARLVASAAVLVALAGAPWSSPAIAATKVQAGQAIAASSADWPAPGYNAQRTNANPLETDLPPATASGLHVAWTENAEPMSGEPAVVGGDVYVICGDALCDFDVATGDQIWRTSLPASGTPTSPTVVDGTVYLASGCTILAINAATGVIAWSTGCTATPGADTDYASIVYPPIVDDSRVIASTSAGDVESFDATTGTPQWTTYVTNNALNLAAGYGTVFATGYNGSLGTWALDESTGALTQNYGIGSNIGLMVTDHRVVIGLKQIDLATSQVLPDPQGVGLAAPQPGPTFSSYYPPAAANGGLYYAAYGNDGGSVTITNPRSLASTDMVKLTAVAKGAIAPGWQSLVPVEIDPDMAPVGGPAVADGVVYESFGNGWLTGTDAATGALIWSYDTNQQLIGAAEPNSPVVADGHLLVVVNSQLYSFSAAPDTDEPIAAPTSITYLPGDRSVLLAWSQPTGGTPTGYTVTVEPSGRTVQTDGPVARIDGLRDWTHYRFTITPQNSGGVGPSATTPTITPRPSETLVAVGRGHQVKLREANGWLNLGGDAISAPAVVASGGTPYVFVLGADHDLMVRTPYSSWHQFGPSTSPCASGPSALILYDSAPATDQLTVACRNKSNKLQYATIPMPTTGLPVTSKWTIGDVTFRGIPGVTAKPGSSTPTALFVLHSPTRNRTVFWPQQPYYGVYPAQCDNSPATIDDGEFGYACDSSYKVSGSKRLMHDISLTLVPDSAGSHFQTQNNYPYKFHGQIALDDTYTGYLLVGLGSDNRLLAYVPPTSPWGVSRTLQGNPPNGKPWLIETIGTGYRYGAALTQTFSGIY